MTIDNKPAAPREDLVRMVATRATEEGNTLFGYAAVFNEWTEIDSWEGRFMETIAPGAFRKTIDERGAQVKVLFNHGMDPSIGDKPLGKPSVMKEDKRGLYVEVPLSATSYNEDIKALLRDDALDGMSFRMTVINERWDNLDAEDGSLPERTITEIRLYEFGVVTFPAYQATQAGIRAHAPKAFEAWRSANPPAPTEPTPDVAPPAEPPVDRSEDTATDEVEEIEPVDTGTETPEPDDTSTRDNDVAADTGTTSPPIIRATKRKRTSDALASMQRAAQVKYGL